MVLSNSCRWKHWLTVTLAFLASFGIAGAAQAQALVINEVDYDQPSADAAEFIELKNISGAAVSLSGYTVVLQNGANNTTYQTITLPSVDVAAGGYFVVCSTSSSVANCNLQVPAVSGGFIQNGAPDAIALRLNGVNQDLLSYEGSVPGFVEGTSAGADTAIGVDGLSRCADGADSDDNGVDFSLRASTPGAANSCGGGGGAIGNCGDPATLISTVQGSGSASPIAGTTVDVEAVLVGDFQDEAMNGFYLQEEDSHRDGSATTSEGLYINEGALLVAANAGDLVRVRGTIAEVSSVTELVLTDMRVCPGAPTATTETLSLPVPSIASMERLEGMRVNIAQLLTVTGNFELGRFGSLDLSINGRLYQPTHLALPGPPALAHQDLNDRSRIILDDLSNSQNPTPIPYKDANSTRRLGDTLPSLQGIFEDRFGALRIRPTSGTTFTNANPRISAPPVVAGRLKVTAVNVLNYFTTLDTGASVCGPSSGLDCRGANTAIELSRQRVKLLNALETLSADVLGLMEVENNATTAIQDIVNGLNDRFGAGAYQFINTGTVGTDAIKVAVIYRPAKVTPVGSYAILTSAVDPLFIDNKNRPSLAQTFAEVGTGARFTLVVNHLKSKGSACTDIGDPDLNDGQANCNRTRTDAAVALFDWISTDPTGSGDPDYLLVGDFNAYAMEDPLTQFKSDGLVALVETLIGPSAYSYQFQGQSGYLDSAFATSGLAPQVTGIGDWHSNADEPVVLDYNLEFKTDDPFNPADPFRSSDHDAVVIGLNLTAPSAAAVPATGVGQLLLLSGLVLGAAPWLMGRRRRSAA